MPSPCPCLPRRFAKARTSRLPSCGPPPSLACWVGRFSPVFRSSPSRRFASCTALNGTRPSILRAGWRPLWPWRCRLHVCLAPMLATGAISRSLRMAALSTCVAVVCAGAGAYFGLLPLSQFLLPAAVISSALWLYTTKQNVGFEWSALLRTFAKSALVAAAAAAIPFMVSVVSDGARRHRDHASHLFARCRGGILRGGICDTARDMARTHAPFHAFRLAEKELRGLVGRSWRMGKETVQSKMDAKPLVLNP